MNNFRQIGWLRPINVLLTTAIFLVSCTTGTSTPTFSGGTPLYPTSREVVKITVESGGSGSEVNVLALTPTAFSVASVATLTSIPSHSAITGEPVIFSGSRLSIHQKCGHGDVVAPDGHVLYATPRLLPGNQNFLELVPEATRVDIVDCRLWISQDGVSWLAVRTPDNKLGWMNVQPDKFYVTVYPITHAPPQAVTGMPAGTYVAYVPPSECRRGPVSNEAVATSIGIDLIPVVGDIKGLQEAATGCDMVTGESLGEWRWLGLLGLIGLSEVALLRHSDETVAGLRLADDLNGSLKYSDEAAMTALRNSDTAGDFLKHLDEVGASVDIGGLRSIHNPAGLSDEAVQAIARLEQPCSFSADTTVLTPEGSLPISQIRPGDLVLGYDGGKDLVSPFAVTAVFSHIDSSQVRLTIGNEQIITTPNHPFYVDGRWIPAGELQPGEAVRSVSGGQASVRQVEFQTEPRTMYNLTVAEAHNYFVGFGGWLVHNACRQVLRAHLLGSNYLPSWTDEISWQAHHIIPVQHESHPFILRAKRAGWQIDDASNGVALPVSDADAAHLGLAAHRGSHSGYSSNVLARLDDLESRADFERWSDARAMTELQKLIVDLRRGFSTGVRLPN